jgi:hypothetical protein
MMRDREVVRLTKRIEQLKKMTFKRKP